MNIKYATEFAREFIKNHPEHKGKVLDYYSLMKDEISEGGSTDHEIGLFIGSCNDLLTKDNLAKDGVEINNEKDKEDEKGTLTEDGKKLLIAEYEDVKGDTKRRFKFIKDHPEVLKYLAYLLKDGGDVYKGGGGVGKMYYHIIEYGQYDNIGYQGYYDTIEEAQKQVEKLSNYFPNQTFEIFADKSRKEPPITTMHNGGGVGTLYDVISYDDNDRMVDSYYGVSEDEANEIKESLKETYESAGVDNYISVNISNIKTEKESTERYNQSVRDLLMRRRYESGQEDDKYAKGNTVKGGELRRFDRHANMSDETRGKILDYTNYPIKKEGFNKSRFSNYLYGLFDGYDYSNTDSFKEQMAIIKNADPEFHKKISLIYEEIKSYPEVKYAKGGGLGDENREMVLNNNKQIRHHTEELHQILKKDKAEVPAWVVSKVGRATTDLSDATHYLEGSIEKAANGMKIGTGRAVENMKDMMKSLYTYNYGEVDKNDKYLLDYQEKLGKSLFDKTYNEELKRLQEYEIESNVFTDSEGLTYNSLKKKMAEKGTNIGGVSKYKKGGPVKDYSGFSNGQQKYIKKILEGISKQLTGESENTSSGGNHHHIFVQLKNDKWMGFHSATDAITFSRPAKTKKVFINILESGNWDSITTRQIDLIDYLEETGNMSYLDDIEEYMSDGGGVGKYKKGGPVKDYTGTDFSKLIDDLKVFLIKYPYIWKKDGKSYVPIEGWQFAAALMGYTTRVVSVNEIENGYMSMAEVIDQDGKVVGSGFGLVTKDEAKWANAPKYELASFSQTRAVSRALRNCISWVIKAAGYKTTPAEEMYGVGSSKMQNMPKYNAPATPKTIVQYPSMTPIKAPMTPPMTTESPMPDAFEEMADMLRPQKSPMAKNPDFKYKDILRDLYSQAVAYSIVLISPKFMSDVEESLLVDDNDLHYTMLERAYLYLLDNNIVLKTTRYMTKLRKIVNGENFAYGGLLKELPIEIYNAIVESGHQNDIISFDIEPFNSNGDRDKTINVEGVDYYISTKINSEEIANDLNNNTSLNHNYYIADIGGNELLISNN